MVACRLSCSIFLNELATQFYLMACTINNLVKLVMSPTLDANVQFMQGALQMKTSSKHVNLPSLTPLKPIYYT